jgi:hypothetical protein
MLDYTLEHVSDHVMDHKSDQSGNIAMNRPTADSNLPQAQPKSR